MPQRVALEVAQREGDRVPLTVLLPHPLRLGLGVPVSLSVPDTVAQVEWVPLMLCVTLPLLLTLSVPLTLCVPLVQKLLLCVLEADTDCEGVLVTLKLPVMQAVGDRDGEVLGEVVGERLPEALKEGVAVAQTEREVVAVCDRLRVPLAQAEAEREPLTD